MASKYLTTAVFAVLLLLVFQANSFVECRRKWPRPVEETLRSPRSSRDVAVSGNHWVMCHYFDQEEVACYNLGQYPKRSSFEDQP
ncbi:hypothetical protein BaRGS_00017701 [Batillaria attramentaria]|uniref:Uncharacterized protein n=1 Tax=Batillaria attramentaria TaxID=370345 RepID=A0ABD0KW47_9CAEN